MNLKRFILLASFLLMFTIFVLPAAGVVAQSPTPSDDEVNAIARQMFCPICENTPLDVCPTDACRDWRELIRQMLAQGKSASEIKQYFVDHYGARVLSQPPPTGLNWLLYVVPPLAFLIGAFLLFRGFRIWRGLSKAPVVQDAAGPEPAGKDEYASRLEEELRKRK